MSEDRTPSTKTPPTRFSRRLVLFSLAYWAGAELSYALLDKAGNFSVIWPPAGIYLGVLLATPRGRWWAVALTASVPNLLSDVVIHHQPFAASLVFLVVNVGAPLIAAALLKVWCRPVFSFARLAHVVAWLLVVAFVSTPLGATGGAALAKTAQCSYTQKWLLWWIGDLLGILALTPLAFDLCERRSWPRTRRALEAAALLASLGAVTWFVFRLPQAYVLPFAVLYLFLLWAAVRFDAAGVAAAATALAVIVLWRTGSDLGPFSIQPTPQSRMLMAQVALATGPALFYIMAALMAERREAVGKLETSNVRLEEQVRARTAELTRANQALRASEERFQTLANGSPVLLWVNGPAGCEFVNREYLDFLGLDNETDVLGYDWSRYIHPEDCEKYVNAYRQACTKQGLFDEEFRFRRYDGEYRWMRSVATPRQTTVGTFQGYVGATFDITARKKLELEREQVLQREQHARQLAEEANRAKDDWLAMVTHELRTPLNAMLGHARFLHLRRQELVPEFADFADLVRRNGERQNEIINDLLDTARITTGKLQLELGIVRLAQVVREALDTVRPAATAREVDLYEYFASDCGTLRGDATRLQQVVWNLLTNAVKFTPAGGCVVIGLRCEEESLVLTVRDTGQGIAPDFLPHVFDRFSQQDTSRTRRHGGLGLGLALVKQIVELHGGTISAASDGVGCGALFSVSLPVNAGGDHWRKNGSGKTTKDPLGQNAPPASDRMDK